MENRAYTNECAAEANNWKTMLPLILILMLTFAEWGGVLVLFRNLAESAAAVQVTPGSMYQDSTR